MKKKIGYVIELNPEIRNSVFLDSNIVKRARVFMTRKVARENKRLHYGNHIEKIHQVELNSEGKPKRIIKRVR